MGCLPEALVCLLVSAHHGPFRGELSALVLSFRPSVPALSFFELNFVNKKQLIVAILLICKILFDEVDFFQSGISCCAPKRGKS